LSMVTTAVVPSTSSFSFSVVLSIIG
jgi:hypothetical protein